MQPGTTAGPFDGGDDLQQEFVTTASGDALRCPSRPGAGAKQEPRLFQDRPELLSTAANRPVMCRGFFISAGQWIVWITLGSSGNIPSGQGVAVSTPATAITLW